MSGEIPSPDRVFPIDHFRDVASWIAGIERRLEQLEHQVKMIGLASPKTETRLQAVEQFIGSIRVVLKEPPL